MFIVSTNKQRRPSDASDYGTPTKFQRLGRVLMCILSSSLRLRTSQERTVNGKENIAAKQGPITCIIPTMRGGR